MPEHPTRRAPCSSDELFQRGATEVATSAVRRRPRRKERLPNYSYAHRRYYLTSYAPPAPRLTRIQEARGPRLGWRGFPRAAAMCNTLTQALAHHGSRRTASATAPTSAVRYGYTGWSMDASLHGTRRTTTPMAVNDNPALRDQPFRGCTKTRRDGNAAACPLAYCPQSVVECALDHGQFSPGTTSQEPLDEHTNSLRVRAYARWCRSRNASTWTCL